MNSKIRTDLALEVHELLTESGKNIPGLRSESRRHEGFTVSRLQVLDAQGEEALGKPRGSYITLETDALLRREEKAFENGCTLLAQELRRLPEMSNNGNILVVGLGNRAITPDAIGPLAIESVMVTRHLKRQLPEHFGSFRPVAAMCSGVLGTTGMESGESVAAIAGMLEPEAVIVIDALASRKPDRLCRTVQLCDTGIVPGSGVGNARQALSRKTLGVPVIAIGVPTVVDAATLAIGLAEKAGIEVDGEALGSAGSMIVTPRDIDKSAADMAKLIGYGINLALHEGLSISDVDMFLS